MSQVLDAPSKSSMMSGCSTPVIWLPEGDPLTTVRLTLSKQAFAFEPALSMMIGEPVLVGV